MRNITKGNSGLRGKSFWKAVHSLIGSGVISGEMQGGNQALSHFLRPGRQDLFVEQLFVLGRRLLVEFGVLLGVGQFQEDLAAARFGVGIGRGQS